VKKDKQVLSTRRLRGATVVSALSEKPPGTGWKSRDVLLEDAYFAYLNGFMDENARVEEFA